MIYIIILHVGIAIWLLRYFSTHDRGPKEPKNALRTAAVFGVLAVFLASFFNGILLPDLLLLHLDGAIEAPATTLVLGSLLVGLIEETIKFLPLAVFIYKKGYFNELTDGVVYFAIAGIWFGAIESISYALMYGEAVGLFRALTMPFLHATFTAIAGVGLARMKFKTRSITSVFLWLSFAISAHAFYDLLVFSNIVALSLAALVFAIVINLSLFRLFRHAQIADENRGLSSVGTNKFCRNCGLPNTGHFFICIHCGKHT